MGLDITAYKKVALVRACPVEDPAPDADEDGRMLAELIGTTDEAIWKNPKPGPFLELINHSDCEGMIGPQTSAKLARDFAEWQERANAYRPNTGVHNDTEEVSAAGEGVVKFH